MDKVRLPKLSANVEEATVTTWAKSEGDRIAEGDLLLEVTTDKGVVEVESPFSGVVRKVVASENSTVPVGYVLALIGGEQEPVPDVDEENRALLETHRDAMESKPRRRRRVRKRRRSSVRATPAARRLAREHDVDLEKVQQASGADTVSEDDVRQYIENSEGSKTS